MSKNTMDWEGEKPKKKKVEPKEESSPALVAKKDFHIVHNDYSRKIKAGDDLSDVPAHYHENLKTEGVI